MSRARLLRWGIPESPPPKHPYRESLIVNAGLALIVVLVAWASGGSMRRAVVIAALFYICASVWAAWRWRRRLRDAARLPREEGDS